MSEAPALDHPTSGRDPLTLVPKADAQQTAKDFKSDQEVRWCPGCGDYAILAAVQGFLPELGLARENIVFISGIGCSSRFPYYMNTYGMHSIHGRAPAIATGLAVTRPDLSVWVITGDGDALSIGGNHLIHALRRNVNLKILLFNNRIYGLTKGQYSPTSEQGKITKSTPMGSLDAPFNPVSLALGAEASFVARTLDSDRTHLTSVLRAAAAHPGTALVEIYQNCNIFNDGAFEILKDKSSTADAVIPLEHGRPIRFGSKAVVRDPASGEPVVVDAATTRLALGGETFPGLDHFPGVGVDDGHRTRRRAVAVDEERGEVGEAGAVALGVDVQVALRVLDVAVLDAVDADPERQQAGVRAQQGGRTGAADGGSDRGDIVADAAGNFAADAEYVAAAVVFHHDIAAVHGHAAESLLLTGFQGPVGGVGLQARRQRGVGVQADAAGERCGRDLAHGLGLDARMRGGPGVGHGGQADSAQQRNHKWFVHHQCFPSLNDWIDAPAGFPGGDASCVPVADVPPRTGSPSDRRKLRPRPGPVNDHIS